MPLFKKSMLVLLALVAIVAGGAYYGFSASEDAVTLEQGTAADGAEDADAAQEELAQGGTAQGAKAVVYVTGAVNRPGLVELAANARVADAVEACGGFQPQADGNGINLAQPVKDGTQIHVPERSAAGADGTVASSAARAAGTGGGANNTAQQIVNINTATAEELDTLPGVGPATAAKIIEYREAEGGFASPEDIMKVKGIGKAKYEKLKDLITV